MKTSSKLASVALLATIIGCGKAKESIPGLAQSDSTRVVELERQVQMVKDKDEADTRLGQYALNMMAKTSGRSISDGLKLSLARNIVRVANDIFETVDAKKAFVTVLAIESGFNRLAQSPTGPKGYGQLAKAAFYEALKDCGVGDLKDNDVWDTELNLYASACYFRKMMEQSDNDPYVAIVSYNQGPNSEAAKQYAKHGTMDNMEALKYVARFSFLKRKVTDEKPHGVPVPTATPVPAAPVTQ